MAEEKSLATAYDTLIYEMRVDTPLTCELLKYIHARIFGHIYGWAGRWRTVTISKPGITWPPPIFVPQAMDDFENLFLKKCRVDLLATDEQFCANVPQIQGEFLVVHPFREGNARTIKLMTDLIALQTGRPLLMYDESDAGRRAYFSAASQAFGRNYLPMLEVIRSALYGAQRK